jgi:hypothetical protein
MNVIDNKRQEYLDALASVQAEIAQLRPLVCNNPETASEEACQQLRHALARQMRLEFEERQRQYRMQLARETKTRLCQEFNELFRDSFSDPFNHHVMLPCDTCGRDPSIDHCGGWEESYTDGCLVEDFSEEIEEWLTDLAVEKYDDEDRCEAYVERRMDAMTDKKAVKLFKKNFDEDFPPCPYKVYCPDYLAETEGH